MIADVSLFGITLSDQVVGLGIGAIFGACLFLAGLADPDKIIGSLRLKDFHAMRTIVVFVLVGMGGVWLLSLGGAANADVKPAALLSNLLGGALLGIGFGLTGYCPGTGLACAATGRVDALVSVVGMLGGALAFIALYPSLAMPLDEIANYGKVTLPEWTGVNPAVWVIPIVAVGGLMLWLTRPRKSSAGNAP
jgi:uncharacterized membrane protein YedE/YeeE